MFDYGRRTNSSRPSSPGLRLGFCERRVISHGLHGDFAVRRRCNTVAMVERYRSNRLATPNRYSFMLCQPYTVALMPRILIAGMSGGGKKEDIG